MDPSPLSALQHWSCCPHLCLLIHSEQAFAENVHTLRGQAEYRRIAKSTRRPLMDWIALAFALGWQLGGRSAIPSARQ